MNNKDELKRLKAGKKCSSWGIFLNILLFLIKLFAGILSGSLSAVADAFNNLTDASASIVSLLGFRFSGLRADSEHPYGHARAEYLSALAVAVIILIIGFEFIKNAIGEIISPGNLTLSPVVFIIMLLSVIIKIIMAIYNYRIGKRINSKALIATSIDSRNDAIMTSSLIIGYALSHVINFNLDGYLALGVGIFIFFGGIMLLKDTLDPLLGQAPDKEYVNYIQQKILSYPHILGTHDLIVHDYGPDKRFASVHVEMAAEDDVMESHDIIDKMEQDFLKNDNINMIIHFDPIITTDDETNSLRRSISHIATKIHPGCTIHDVRTSDNTISFDCVKPLGCTMSDEALIAALDVAIRLSYPDCRVVVTVDSSFSPIIN